MSADRLDPFDMKVEKVCNFKRACVECQKDKSKKELRCEEKKHNAQNKLWTFTFTCLASRNISSELLQDKTTNAILMAFQWYIAQNSCPKSILTDKAA